MSVSIKKGPILDPGLCRCCRGIKKCRILTSEYLYMGQKEIYAEMIMDCFGVLLSHTEENMKDSGVCATCVILIRQATEFKKQVLQCEEMFLQSKMEFHTDDVVDSYEDIKTKLELKLRPQMKVEPDGSVQDDCSYLDGAAMDDPDYCDEQYYETPLKSPKSEQMEVKPNVTEPHLSTDEDDLPLIREKMKKKKIKVKKQRKKKIKNGTTKEEKLPAADTDDIKEITERDLDYMAEENLLTIIENSYVCPFKNRRNNYYCYYCKDYFPKPEDLREHTATHDTKPFQLLMGYKKMPKLDITRIDCRLCEVKIDDIETFKTHIDTIHGKKVYYEAPDKLLLYKLTWNNLICVLCNDVFEDFNGLNNHMVDHFSNFTCHVCGMCFLEKPRLDAHLKRHKDDEKHTCEICGKTFKSNHYKDMHVDIVHKKKAIIRCPKCDECFMSYALKNKHLQDAHGQKRVYPCNLCDKVYNRQKTLTEHQRRNHQKVMKHQCEFCEQRFYLPSRLKEHMATHTGERNYRCEHCDKSYPRLKSLQYHIRTHTNDRRYRCHVCGQAFIQNASLKSHLKTHHPDCDIEGCYF